MQNVLVAHIYFAYSVTVTEPLQDLLKLKDLETDVSGNGKVCHFVHGHKPIGQVRHQDNRPGNC